VDVYAEGDGVRVQGSWTFAEGILPSLYSASYRLLDVDGVVVTQTDVGFPQAPVALADVKLAVPPGTYETAVIVYAWETGAVLGERSLGAVMVE
jgi:hypothetical protein